MVTPILSTENILNDGDITSLLAKPQLDGQETADKIQRYAGIPTAFTLLSAVSSPSAFLLRGEGCYTRHE
jgi:hypothetical protein